MGSSNAGEEKDINIRAVKVPERLETSSKWNTRAGTGYAGWSAVCCRMPSLFCINNHVASAQGHSMQKPSSVRIER